MFNKLVSVLDFARAASSSSGPGAFTREALRSHDSAGGGSAYSRVARTGDIPLGASAVSEVGSRASQASRAATLATVLSSLRASPKYRAAPPKSEIYSYRPESHHDVHHHRERHDYRGGQEEGDQASAITAPSFEGKRKHRGGHKHLTVAKMARVSRAKAEFAITEAERLTEEARVIGIKHEKNQDKHKARWNRNSGSGDTGGAGGSDDGRFAHLPAAPQPEQKKGNGYELEVRISGKTSLARIKELEEEGHEAAREERGGREGHGGDQGEYEGHSHHRRGEPSDRLISLSKRIMGLLRYGNLGNKRQCTVPPLGWRTAEEIGELLGQRTADIVAATESSFYRGECRYEFSEGSGDNPSIRPFHNNNRRERG